MLKITSDWSIQPIKDKDGNEVPTPVFTLFMEKDKQVFNCAVDGNSLDDADDVVNTLRVVIDSLARNLYPELSDPIYKAKKELDKMEKQVGFLRQHIETMEKTRQEKEAAA